jgi:hypothetical protein
LNNCKTDFQAFRSNKVDISQILKEISTLKKIFLNLIIATLAVAALVASVAGCSTSAPVNTPTSAEIQSTTDPLTENILVGLNKDNYALFSGNFTDSFKDTINQSAFEQLFNQIKNSIGNYQTKAFFDASTQGSVVTAAYICRYTNEPAGVTVMVTFQVSHNVYLVDGLVLNSPILSGQTLDVSALRTYADSETENVLTALKNNDYTGFSKDLNQSMKTAMTKAAFDKLYNQLKTSIGSYESKVFEEATNANSVITCQYLAAYSDETAGVWITISFDSSKKIAGLYFNSPKLRATSS